MSIPKSKQTALLHHWRAIRELADAEIASMEIQGVDGAREAVDLITNQATALTSILDDPDEAWDDGPERDDA